MLKKNSHRVLTIMLVLAFTLASCQNAAFDPQAAEGKMLTSVAKTLTAAPTLTPVPTSTSTPTPTITPTAVPVLYGPTDFPDNINPLTGLEVEDPSILDRRPVLIKVANQLAARPHAGLSNADIVFDYYIGSGGDRFTALFYGKDDNKVGSVRSGRYVDVPLTQMYNGVLGMVSAWKPVLDEILGTLGGRVINSEHCDNGYDAICRQGPATDETSVFANSEQISELYDSRDPENNVRQTLDGMAFGTIPPSGGVPAEQFTMHYGKNYNQQWNYDEASKKYLRWIDDVDYNGNSKMIPLVDRNTGEQLAFSNVVVIFAELQVLNGTADSIHRYRFASKNGRALVFRDGMMYEVVYKSAWNEPFSFYDEDGNPFRLQPGNTWMHLTGLGSKLEEQPAGTWMVSLRMP